MFSDTLKKLQNEKGVTNYRIAKDLGIHPSSVKNWLTGTLPRAEQLIALAKYFDVSVNDLLQ